MKVKEHNMYNASKQHYLDTIEDINTLDKSNDVIAKTFKGTGTLGQNDAYMIGYTSNVKLPDNLKQLLFEEVAKKQIIIDMFQDKTKDNLYRYSYMELLYMVAGAYAADKLSEVLN